VLWFCATSFITQELFILPAQWIPPFYRDRRRNTLSIPMQLTRSYNRYKRCFLRGTKWIFI